MKMVGSLERMIMDGFYHLMKVRSWLSHKLAIHQMMWHCYCCSNGGLFFCVVIWWTYINIFLNHYCYFCLAEVSNQMLELYEQNRVPPSQGSEVEGSVGSGPGPSHRALSKPASVTEEQASKQISSRLVPDSSADNHSMPQRSMQNQSNENGSTEMGSVITDHEVDVEIKDGQHPEHLLQKEVMREVPNRFKSGTERVGGEDQERIAERNESAEAGEWRDDGPSRKSSSMVGRNLELRDGPVGQSPKEAIKMIDKDKVKAALEKRRKSRGEITRKKDVMDEDDLIERELEDGVELAVEDEKNKRDRRQSWSKYENLDQEEIGEGNHLGIKGQSSRGLEVVENAEEGEMLDEASPILNSRKRKGGSPVERQLEGKKRHDYITSSWKI
jgi:cyclin T